jgi:GT2 family glycosyltransferase
MMPKASVIVVNYNGKDITLDCLKALDAQSFEDFEVIVVDNNSSDNSVAEIRKFKETNHLSHPVKIFSLTANKGFASANMAGLVESDAEYIALLNNDTEPGVEWLERLVKAMDANPEVGICATKMIAVGTDLIDSAGDGYSSLLKGFKRGEGRPKHCYGEGGYVFGACAGAALYRRRMIDHVGFLDEDFFLLHEDTDLNLRAQIAGWKVLYVPDAIVYHKVSSSIGRMSDLAVYYTLRNGEFVRIKNVPFPVFIRCLPGFVIGMISELFYFAVRHGKWGLYYRAKKDAMRNLTGMLAKRKKIMAMRKVDCKYLGEIMTPLWDREFFSSKIRKLFFG